MDEKVLEEIENKIRDELKKEKISPDMFGYVNAFEKRKKEILKNEYNIDYKTTQEECNGCSID